MGQLFDPKGKTKRRKARNLTRTTLLLYAAGPSPSQVARLADVTPSAVTRVAKSESRSEQIEKPICRITNAPSRTLGRPAPNPAQDGAGGLSIKRLRGSRNQGFKGPNNPATSRRQKDSRVHVLLQHENRKHLAIFNGPRSAWLKINLLSSEPGSSGIHNGL